MNPDIQRLIRAHIHELKPYSSARDEYKGSTGVFLDANENPFGSVSGGDYNRYPDPYQKKVKQELSALKGIAENRIFLGNGSDEIIDLLFRVFCEPDQDKALVFPPTFGMYEASAQINKVALESIPLTREYQLDLDNILGRFPEQLKLTFVCSPNNPTGNLIDKGSIEKLLIQLPGLLVVDEAYIDFADGSSCLDLLETYPRLVILQTFSKAWGMANLRLGMAFAAEEIVEVLGMVKLPYNVNGLSQKFAYEALQNQGKKEEMVSELLEGRRFLEKELRKFDLVKKVYPSDSNFLLVKMDDANLRYQQLIGEKVVVRNRSRVPLCENCLRISVGTYKENVELIEKISSLS